MKTLPVLSFVGLLLTGCVTSQTIPIGQVENAVRTPDDSGVTVFLLEREIPQDIKKLGVVTLNIQTNTAANSSVDRDVKAQLHKACKELGANGAYRINDGTYFPALVSYLVFSYKKQTQS